MLFPHPPGFDPPRTVLRLSLVLVAALCSPLLLAAQIDVTSESGQSGGPDCTLRDAISAADSDTAVGGCQAGSGADVIVLPVDAVITLNEAVGFSNGDGSYGLEAIESIIEIEGRGSTIERDDALDCVADFTTAEGEFRLFYVDGGELSISDATLRNGCAGDNTFSRGVGGAIFVRSGSLNLDGVRLEDNFATGNGGALSRSGPGTSTIDRSYFGRNEAGRSGGAISNGGGTTTVVRSTIEGNFASSSGGGLASSFGTIEIIETTVSENTATGSGGGISGSNLSVQLRVLNSTLSGNQVTNARSDGRGGGIVSRDALEIRFSTLADNEADTGSALVIDSNTDSDDDVIVTGSILSGSSSVCTGSVELIDAVGANLSSDASCPGFSIVDSAPLLGPLADNGGPTFTHAIDEASPAFDQGGDCVASPDLTTDQRGRSRPGAGSSECDLGAFEYELPLIFSDGFEP
jgi:predicted outer membrane repeat protein